MAEELERQAISSAVTSTCPITSDNSTLVQPKPVQQYRRTFYESPHEAVVEIFARGLKPEEVKVEFGVQTLKVVIDSPSNEPYSFQTRLNQKVSIEKCKYNILNPKVEIRLAKAVSSLWKILEYKESQEASIKTRTVDNYPSSSKKAQNWDKISAELKEAEKDEVLEGDAAADKFFRDMYQNVDEDKRRAMIKSFVESNGTVLSTNWKDVGEKPVEVSTPSGMEMKKWD